MSRPRRSRICVIRQAALILDPRVRREVAALTGAGHEVDVICLRRAGQPWRTRDGLLTVYGLPLSERRPRRPAGYPTHYGAFFVAAMMLSGLLHLRRRYDVVQVHSLPDVLVYAAIIPRLLGAKVVLDLHEAMVEFFTTKFGVDASSRSARLVAAAEQASIRFADFAFTCTNEMRDAMTSRGADPARIGVVLNASEEHIFDVVRHPPRGGGDGRYVVLCHGSVEERYGIDTGIRAVALLRDELPSLQLRVVGDGAYLPEARRLTRALGVEDRVSFSGGWVPMSELLDEIAGCDAGLVAMKVDAFRDLTHCNKMYDLVTMRRPVLMSRTRSVRAYFGEACFEYFEGDDPADLARAIRALHADEARGARLVADAASRLEPYRWPRQREHYVALIGKVLQSDGVAPSPTPVVPARPEATNEHYLHERYVRTPRRAPALNAYYALKPLLPRRTQLTLRRAYARVQRRRQFPSWPIETILVDRQHEELRRRLRAGGGEPVAFVNFWPEDKRFAAILTHDVEGPAGIANIPRVLEVERRHGFVSSWNFVAEDYAIPDGLFDELRAAGCEIGLHGIRHDGKLFKDRASFESGLPAIGRYMAEWGAVGFRSPATHRNAAWMAELPALYDSSFPDTDPFEPQAGGCCSIFPFRFGEVVELPITLVQDHTLWEILREPGIDRWRQKCEWIIANHGLINVIVHPDYVIAPERLRHYDDFLAFLAARRELGWHALPRDVARWWRQREDLAVAPGSGGLLGACDFAATIAYAREAGGRIEFESAARVLS